MLGSLCVGDVEIDNFAPGADNRSTLEVFEALGAELELDESASRVVVRGRGPGSLSASSSPLDCGNSGTTMRLLTGLLVGLGIDAELIGDASLSRRPMRRITEPLSLLGGALEARGEGGSPPVVVDGTSSDFRGGAWRSKVASAQVKSSLLLAALAVGAPMRVVEPSPSRDHTEVMLAAMGVDLRISDHYRDVDAAGEVFVELPRGALAQLTPTPIVVPGDISSAAFLMVAAAIVPDSAVRLVACGVTPTRTGVLDVLRALGLPFEVDHARVLVGGEPVADILVRYAEVEGFEIAAEMVPRAVDEIPVLAVLAGRARGTSRFYGLAELRVKESDRLAKSAELLERCGCAVTIEGDTMTIEGRGDRPFEPFVYDAEHDHRMAAAAIVASLVASGPCEVVGVDSLAVSYPKLLDDLGRLQSGVD